MAAAFDTGYLPGGANARLVIRRDYDAAEKLTFRGLIIWDLADPRDTQFEIDKLRIVSVAAVEEGPRKGDTELTFAVPGIDGNMPFLDAHVLIAACKDGTVDGRCEDAPLYVVERSATVSSRWFPISSSISFVVALYTPTP